MPHFEGPRVTSSDALERLKELGPWFYEFDLGEYGRTESELPLEVRPVHESRLAMVERVVDEYFRGRLEQSDQGSVCARATRAEERELSADAYTLTQLRYEPERRAPGYHRSPCKPVGAVPCGARASRWRDEVRGVREVYRTGRGSGFEPY